MKYETRIHPSYERQQQYLDDIARELGVVAYRPDYHAAKNDKNTVLFYTRVDHEYNKSLPEGSRHEGYRDYFWWFENTDVKGAGTYDFANRGKIDLRGLTEKEVLRTVIGNALKRKMEKEGKSDE